ncbi:hypothetical protein ACQR35_00230 [Pseudarthrobacter sp. J1738]|uniref:hypothetical protein n=1 Tax=Pseudarthrobacter sp. J1738 TaxID=3420446 RepID=UPI003D2A7CBC
MTFDNDVASVPTPQDAPVETEATARSWDHIGAIILDAALQRRQNYHATVRPRVLTLIEAWPDAATTSGFRAHLDGGTLSEVIDWPSPGRLAQVDDMTAVLEIQRIETVAELRAAFDDAAKGADLREAMGAVLHVSPKTLDYIEALSQEPANAVEE